MFSFFKDINDRDIITYTLSTEWSDEQISKELKELFSVVKERNPYNGNTLSKEELWKRLEAYVKKRKIVDVFSNLLRHPLLGFTIGEILNMIK